MTDTISSWLQRDHRRLGALLNSAIEGDAEAYAKLRAGLHLDHSALAALLVPSPTRSLLERARLRTAAGGRRHRRERYAVEARPRRLAAYTGIRIACTKPAGSSPRPVR